MGNVEIPKWLKNLPLAPEFHPTDTEFADPIAYISKIEKQASAFGICKIIPPLPKPSKKYVFYNLNKSLSKSPELINGASLPRPSSLKTGAGDGANDREARAVFTTRHQELGQCAKKTKGNVKENPQFCAHKQVWQSGEVYTLEQFESKSKAVARSLLGSVKEINAMVIEALFWRAASEKPIYVEYANDVPGSGFGEPEGQFQYFHKRRRKRVSYKSFRPSKEKTHCENIDLDAVSNLSRDRYKGSHSENEPSSSAETIPGSSTTPASHAEETSRTSSDDMAGSAGWKLSNSPWNLQVIARSPGSLTRFMPDDIPGVTSPMVYIGMLFSWFAWHVEDHELHSMNFLHTGSPKTWYSVPGDYAFTFEEVIRTEAYGGKIDRLAALSMLGEKTTILSPEVVVSSGIPCCRLVQNPGEFVVTFPRAYHIGFSHGFNCGEAANFGTPQWLKVAKEAAVRRAAMNFLPMLSHQHLLYLLTMSFVSRVPRSFLPGARSSRLRDRMKEERELSVKKAFIEDVLEQNNTLSVILSKESDFGVLIWNPDLLPCTSKESQSPSMNSSMTEENVHHTRSEDNSNATGSDLLEEMSLYMGTLNNLYMENDDMSSDFQVDSGTLVCAACGILGFPFMTVIQPSDQTSTECFFVDHPLVQHGCDTAEPTNCHSSALPNGSFRSSFRDLTVPSGWNNSNKFLRPRIFCLEHGLQIEELLRSKGGSNRHIICHSDFQKIKAHVVTIAEEISTPFQYKEVPLRSASQEELNLIYLALEGEDRGEDWTSKMGINLQYCVNARKNSPSFKVQHGLALGGLFSDGFASDFSIVKWQSRKPRSRMKLPQPAQPKPLDAVEAKEDNVLVKKPDSVIEKEDRLIQYTRRKYKAQIDASSEKIMEQVSLIAPTVGVESVATQVENCTLSESKKNGNACDLTATERVSSRFGENGDSDVLGCSETCVSEAIEMPKMQGEDRIVGDTSIRNDILNSVSEEKHDHLALGEQMGNGTAVASCTNDEAFDETSSDRVMQTRQEENASCSAMQVEIDRSKEDLDTNQNNTEEPDSCFSCQMPDTTVHIGLENLDAEEKEIHLDDGLSTNNEVKNITDATNALNRKECPLKSSQTEDESLGADNSAAPIVADPMPTSKKGGKRKSELDQLRDDQSEMDAFIRSPCEGLRPRAARDSAVQNPVQDDPVKKKARKFADTPVAFGKPKATTKRPHKCDLEGCKMSFETSAELQLHKRNRCPYEGCGKRFSSHKYAVIHQRVHEDDRPLKCPWKGCAMSFKWAWARTEHIRVHTGEKPYKCKVEGCGRSFRFVSDFSRHRRKTGHSGA